MRSDTPVHPTIPSAFMPLIGTTTAFVTLVTIGFALGGAAIMAMM